MGLYSVRLHPRGALHLGERGIGYEETADLVHADTLFSALCAAWAVLHGESALARDLLPQPDESWEPPFLLSSAFPRAGEVRLYPTPLLDPPRERPIEWKDVRWVSEAVFIAWLSGCRLPPVRALHGGQVAVSEDELSGIAREADGHRPGPELWKSVRVPRVTLDAASQASDLWHFGRVRFAPGCGLHFWVQIRRLEERFWPALRLLGDMGIGGDRSAGHGLFSATWAEERPPWPASDVRFVTLSPVYPDPSQVGTLLGEQCSYRLLTRAGWIGTASPTPYRRKTVRLLAEGSVLTGSSQRTWGCLPDVTPEGASDLPHRVYRWGYAFPAGVLRQ
jgi:CRISPR-associated protein Csm4